MQSERGSGTRPPEPPIDDPPYLELIPGDNTAPASFPLTDLGNAQALAHYHGRDIRYCYSWKSWLVWDGTHWKIDSNGEIRRRAEDVLQNLMIAAWRISDSDKKDKTVKFIANSMANRKVKDMIEAAQSRLPVTVEELDTGEFLLNCQNGTIDLTTGQLLPHCREHLITKIVPYNFDPLALAPSWNDFLHRTMMGKEALVSYLQRAVGYALSGSTREQVIFLLHGSGSNGKSTFLDIIGLLLAGYAMQMDSETITMRQPGKMANDIARLRGARFVAASETEEGRRLAESKVKQMTGGDKLVGEFKFQEPFEFTPQFKIFLATNHLPRIHGTDNAIWRRLPLIKFEARFWNADRGEEGDLEYQADVTLPARLRNEMPGILRWAVDGCIAWQQEGLGQPIEVREATASYRAEMDTLAQFLDDCVVEHDVDSVSKKDVYQKYKKWCEDGGEYAFSQKMLGIRLRERGWEDRKTSGRGWLWLNKMLIGA